MIDLLLTLSQLNHLEYTATDVDIRDSDINSINFPKKSIDFCRKISKKI